jgi:hypothetical protein
VPHHTLAGAFFLTLRILLRVGVPGTSTWSAAGWIATSSFHAFRQAPNRSMRSAR